MNGTDRARGHGRHGRPWLGLLAALLCGGCVSGLGPAGREGNAALRQPRNAAAQIAAGRKYMQAKQYNDAFICYSRAVAADPNSFDAQLGLARACAYLGDAADGLAAAKKAQALKPAEGGPRIASGLLKLASVRALGDPKAQLQALTEAEKLLTDGVGLVKGDAAGWEGLGETRALRARLRMQAARATAARGQQPSKAIGDQIGKDLGGAITAYARARTYAPKNADLAYALGGLYQIQGQVDQAEASYEEAVRLQPQNPQFQLALAWLLIAKGSAAQAAREAAQAALQAGDTSGDAALAAAVAVLQEGNAVAATKEITAGLRQYEQSPDWLYWYVEALLRLDPNAAAADPALKGLDIRRRAVAAHEMLTRQLSQGAPCRAQPQDIVAQGKQLEPWVKSLLGQGQGR